MDRAYTGVWPVAPTPFHADGTVDVDGMRRVLDCIVDQGVDGVCILANFSEQFLLTDEERDRADARLAGAPGRPRAGDRHLLALLDRHRRRAGATAPRRSARRWSC